MTNIQLVQSEFFGEVKCDFWEDENDEILMTRKQIGEALEYSDPVTAITKLHSRHKNRLDKHSVPTKLVGTDNKMYNTYLYNSKGVMEVCRWSKQPKADAFMDWVWDVIDEIRRTGRYSLENRIPKTLPEALRAYAAALEENEKLIKENETMKPKAGMYDTLISAGNSQSMTEVAKCFGVGRNKLFKILREEKVLMSGGSKKNLPFQRYIDNDYFDVREVNINRSDSNWNVTQTLVAAKGLDLIGKVLRKRGYIQEIA